MFVLLSVAVGSTGCDSETADIAPSPTAQSAPQIAAIPSDDDACTVRFSIDLTPLPTDVVSDLRAAPDIEQAFRLHRVAKESVDARDRSVFSVVQLTDSELTLKPSFPLLAGESYLAVFDPSKAVSQSTAGSLRAELVYSVPVASVSTAPEIEAVYPTASQLPANHLKFYIVFSEPMQQGVEIFDYFQLVDLDTGETVPRPFRHTELWSSDDCRLTLWFHPGRQKTGVNLNVEIGPVLMAGHRYQLLIDRHWESRRGVHFATDHIHEFIAVDADHRQPDIDTWQLEEPYAGTMSPIVCRMKEPLDWALLNSGFRVESSGGEMILGDIHIARGETEWSFAPIQPWQVGNYTVVVEALVEDLAGNSFERAFEVDVTEPTSQSDRKSGRREPLRIPFQVRAAASNDR